MSDFLDLCADALWSIGQAKLSEHVRIASHDSESITLSILWVFEIPPWVRPGQMLSVTTKDHVSSCIYISKDVRGTSFVFYDGRVHALVANPLFADVKIGCLEDTSTGLT